MISKTLQDAINQQIVNELYASNAYLAVASYMDAEDLKVLSAHFFEQSHEERTHALKLLKYLLEVKGCPEVGAIPEPPRAFKSVEQAVELSLKQEEVTTKQINDLMSMAHDERDYATISFLKWFVDEQVEELASMNELLGLVKRAGDQHLLLVEDRLTRRGLIASDSAPKSGD